MKNTNTKLTPTLWEMEKRKKLIVCNSRKLSGYDNKNKNPPPKREEGAYRVKIGHPPAKNQGSGRLNFPRNHSISHKNHFFLGDNNTLSHSNTSLAVQRYGSRETIRKSHREKESDQTIEQEDFRASIKTQLHQNQVEPHSKRRSMRVKRKRKKSNHLRGSPRVEPTLTDSKSKRGSKSNLLSKSAKSVKSGKSSKNSEQRYREVIIPRKLKNMLTESCSRPDINSCLFTSYLRRVKSKGGDEGNSLTFVVLRDENVTRRGGYEMEFRSADMRSESRFRTSTKSRKRPLRLIKKRRHKSPIDSQMFTKLNLDLKNRYSHLARKEQKDYKEEERHEEPNKEKKEELKETDQQPGRQKKLSVKEKKTNLRLSLGAEYCSEKKKRKSFKSPKNQARSSRGSEKKNGYLNSFIQKLQTKINEQAEDALLPTQPFAPRTPKMRYISRLPPSLNKNIKLHRCSQKQRSDKKKRIALVRTKKNHQERNSLATGSPTGVLDLGIRRQAREKVECKTDATFDGGSTHEGEVKAPRPSNMRKSPNQKRRRLSPQVVISKDKKTKKRERHKDYDFNQLYKIINFLDNDPQLHDQRNELRVSKFEGFLSNPCRRS